MVEQWPFKPLVAGSSPSALTFQNRRKGGFSFPTVHALKELTLNIIELLHKIRVF